jgi:hypothetical protein
MTTVCVFLAQLPHRNFRLDAKHRLPKNRRQYR